MDVDEINAMSESERRAYRYQRYQKVIEFLVHEMGGKADKIDKFLELDERRFNNHATALLNFDEMLQLYRKDRHDGC